MVICIVRQINLSTIRMRGGSSTLLFSTRGFSVSRMRVRGKRVSAGVCLTALCWTIFVCRSSLFSHHLRDKFTIVIPYTLEAALLQQPVLTSRYFRCQARVDTLQTITEQLTTDLGDKLHEIVVVWNNVRCSSGVHSPLALFDRLHTE